MTVSTTDLGGTGNGLGLPIANPLYGPATAAAMGNQAWNQNMQQAQAQTQQTQAQTKFFGAQTENTQQEAWTRELQNRATDTVPDAVRGTWLAAEGKQKVTAAEGQAVDLFNKQYIALAPQLDQMPPEQAKSAVARIAATAGVSNPNQYADLHAGLAGSMGQSAGPAGNIGGHQALADAMIKANAGYKQAELETGSREKINTQTTQTEKQIADARIASEEKRQQIDVTADPTKASQFYYNKFVEATNSGDQALAEQYRSRSLDAFARAGNLAAIQSFARNAYGPNLPALGIANNAGAGPGQPPQVPGGAGAPSQGQSGGGTVTGPDGKPIGFRVISPNGGQPQGGPPVAGGMVPNSVAPIQPVPTGPGGPGQHAPAGPTPTTGGPMNGSWQVSPEQQQAADQQAAIIRIQEAQQQSQQTGVHPVQILRQRAMKIGGLIQQQGLRPEQTALLQGELRHIMNAIKMTGG
jgi:hypothetical protein